MRVAERSHDDAVGAWLQQASQEASVDSLIQAFERMFAALWRRSFVTLGEVTLTAIVERVLQVATTPALHAELSPRARPRGGS